MNYSKKFLKEVLDIVDYTDDKDMFIMEFSRLFIEQALKDYLNLLPEEQKNLLQKQLTQEKDPLKLQSLLEPHMKTNEYQNLMQQNWEKLFQSYLETITPNLSQEQKTKLDIFLSSTNNIQTQNSL